MSNPEPRSQDQNDDDVEWFIYRQGMQIDDIPWGVQAVRVQAGVTRIESDAFCNPPAGHWGRYTTSSQQQQQPISKYAKLTRIQIASSVQSIGAYAFSRCTNVVRVEIPADSQLRVIEAGAFEFCSSWTGPVTLPASLQRMEDGGAFQECGLSRVDFEDTAENPCQLTMLGDSSFRNCSRLCEIVLPRRSLRRIGSWAFADCPVLERLEIPASCQQIDETAIETCTALSSVEFGSITALRAAMAGQPTFQGCTTLSSIDWPHDSSPLALWPRLMVRLSFTSPSNIKFLYSSLCSYQEEIFGES